MYMKSLEMRGFKSFVDSTKLEFPRGFTAVVGPNGCGKSNISDAIRWVIGEQSSKTLRGSKMEDLVFNGSESRKALGMAEVSLTIANLPKTTVESAVPVVEEAKVTRRFYRSGESEYFINKTPCRLRDIIDLFLDTGISSRAFSIIEQGTVLNLINAKPVDRRFIIEEAAGIMKYKYRRNEALRKMAAAQENLVRVNDTMNELRRQLGSLKRQASKAESYKKKKTELRDITLNLYAVDYRGCHKEFDNISKELTGFREDKEKQETGLTALNNRMEALKIDITHREKEINKFNESNIEIEGRMKGEEARVELMKGQIEEAVNVHQRAIEEISQMEEELEKISENLTLRQDESDKVVQDIASLEGSFEEKNISLQKIKTELDHVKSSMEEFESYLRDLNHVISQQEHKRISIQAHLDLLAHRGDKTQSEKQELSTHIEEANRAGVEAKERFESIISELKKQKEKQGELLVALGEKNEELKKIVFELEEKKDSKSRLSGKLSSLEDFQKNFEGLQEGARNLLKKAQKDGESDGVRCMLADVIEAAPEYELAVETILGDRLQGLIVEDHQAGRNAIDYLKLQGAGRSTFIPVATRKIGNPIVFPDVAEGEVIGKVVDFINTPSEYREIVNALLEDVLMVENLEKALSLWSKAGTNCSFVTLEGDIIDPKGIIVGGSSLKDDSGLLRKKRIIHELQSDFSTLSQELEGVNGRLLGKRNTIAELEGEKTEIDRMVLACDRQYIHDEKDLRQIKESLEKEQKRLEVCQLEIQDIQVRKERSKEEIDPIEIEINKLKDKREASEEESTSAKENLAHLREILDEAKEEVSEYNMKLVSLKSKKENITLDMQRLQANRSTIGERIERMRQNDREAKEKKDRLEEEIKITEIKIIELFEKNRTIKSSCVEKGEVLREILDAHGNLEMQAKENSRELEILRGRVQERELKKTEFKLRLDNILQRLQDDFDAGIEELLSEYTEEVDREESSRAMAALRDRISQYGDVNLGALEEYNVVKERYEFMDEQYSDLTASIADLNKAIEKINKTTSQRFMETFEKVNENFKKSFRRLFSGGRAELVLTQPDDPLETGLDIEVQPPGKKLQNITMLSAGEKTMTALSILFSVFMTKPSPFCLLDEVDAPLDEANINRFREMLRDLSDKTQFIIITHNQTTMTFAETLYGITMEEKGVSKIVSVNLENKKKPEEKSEIIHIPESGMNDEKKDRNGLEAEFELVGVAKEAGKISAN